MYMYVYPHHVSLSLSLYIYIYILTVPITYWAFNVVSMASSLRTEPIKVFF